MKLRWSTPALGDLLDVRRFIVAENPQAAVATVARIRHSAGRLAQFPGPGTPLDVAGLRGTTVPGTPFRILHRIEGDVILVVAVWHGARQWPPARD